MSKFCGVYGFYYFHIFANIWPTSIRYSQAGSCSRGGLLCLVGSLVLGFLSLFLSGSLVNSFPVRIPQLACTSFVQFDGVVCGFVPVALQLSLTLTSCPHFTLSVSFFALWLKQKLQQKFRALHWQLLVAVGVALKVSLGGA